MNRNTLLRFASTVLGVAGACAAFIVQAQSVTSPPTAEPQARYRVEVIVFSNQDFDRTEERFDLLPPLISSAGSVPLTPRIYFDAASRQAILEQVGSGFDGDQGLPTTMPAPETYTALQRGTVDAVGFPFSYTFAAYKLDEISTWYTTNMSAGMVNCFTAISQPAWEKLPKQYQAILDEALPGAYKAMIDAYDAEDKINIPKWEKSGKLTAVTFTEEELVKFQKLGGQPVWKQWVDETKPEVPTAQALLDLVLKTANDANKSKAVKK